MASCKGSWKRYDKGWALPHEDMAKRGRDNYSRNARISTDQTGNALSADGLLSNPINPGNTESGTN